MTGAEITKASFFLIILGLFFFVFFKILLFVFAMMPEALHLAHSINEIVDRVGVDGVQKLIEGVSSGAIQ